MNNTITFEELPPGLTKETLKLEVNIYFDIKYGYLSGPNDMELVDNSSRLPQFER